MAGAVLKVDAAGPLVSIQDGGRPGFMRFGVPASGAMDKKALVIANRALGRDPGAPVIEISRGGLALECLEGAVTLALVGGGFLAGIEGKPLGSWQIFTLSAGERLTITVGPWGSWTYLAFAGTLDVPDWLHSRSTHSQSGFGGGKLNKGNEFTLRDAKVRTDLEGPIPCPVWARPRHLLHVTYGPQDRFFPPSALENLIESPFALTDAYDRMGVRLSGPSLRPEGSLSIPSEAVLRGSIQVSGDGIPAILLSDHQTTGGYPKIATVFSDDIDGFVQCRPRDKVHFKPISPERAVMIAQQRQRVFDAYLGTLDRGRDARAV
jgi:biotin-dependent carboxylase-like uncharacterized protein